MSALDFSRPIVVLEAATADGSVALLMPNRAAAGRGVRLGAGSSDTLFPALTALFAEAELAPTEIGAVVCGAGPGSFTSLRIAAALAKGLAHGTGAPLYALPSLALAAAALPTAAPPGTYLVHADALRGERFVLTVVRDAAGDIEPQGEVTREAIDDVRSRSTPAARVAVGPVPALLPSEWMVQPDARQIVRVGGPWRASPVDLAHWEPTYGRLAEAQVKWEAAHGRALPSG